MGLVVVYILIAYRPESHGRSRARHSKCFGEFGRKRFLLHFTSPRIYTSPPFGIDDLPAPSEGYQAYSPRPVAAFVVSGLVGSVVLVLPWVRVAFWVRVASWVAVVQVRVRAGAR